MNKTAIKNFAIWARNKLISDIQFRAQLLGVLPDRICEPLPQSDSQTQFFDIGTKDYVTVKGGDVSRRAAFVEALQAKAARTDYATAYKTIIEKVAYTWFNRLIAIRFMEVNDYLPGRVRVLSSTLEGKAEPDLVSNPFEGGLMFTEQEQDTILRFKDENRLDELFRMLFIMECQSLSAILPGLFVKKEESLQPRDYYALLLNINFTDRDGLVWHLTHDIPERDFRVRTREDDLRQAAEGIPEEEMPAGQVEIIGWLYQYYNTELKNEVFAGLKKNKKIGADDIPAATQLFTPEWIVRYMVENSLGRLWTEHLYSVEDTGTLDLTQRITKTHMEGNCLSLDSIEDFTLIPKWKYFLYAAEQDEAVMAQIKQNRASLLNLKPEDIRVIDPCCGSGHIAVYLFDVLVQIYESQGWTRRDAAQSIVQNNLYALDIDDRAAQLAYFAVMMKAREYDRRFFSRGIQPHVYTIPESNELNPDYLSLFGDLQDDAKSLWNDLCDAKTYGSLITPQLAPEEIAALCQRLEDIRETVYDNFFDSARQNGLIYDFTQMLNTCQALAQKYDVVVTNPPYMGSSGMGAKLSKYVKDHYPDSKSDLFAVFIERCHDMTKTGGYQAMITQHAWMFLSSYEKLRAKLQKIDTINMAHLGARAFDEIGGEVVQTTSFVLQNAHIKEYKGTYCRLIDPTTQQGKEEMFLAGANRYATQQDNFAKIPGAPVAYWVSERFFNNFSIGTTFLTYCKACSGLKTGNNERFTRLWYEVQFEKIGFDFGSTNEAKLSKYKWFPYNKGGDARCWYGNRDLVVNFEKDGAEIRETAKQGISIRITSYEVYFHTGVTWSALTSSRNTFRFSPKGSIFDSNKGPMFINSDNELLLFFLGLFNSCVARYTLNVMNPSLSLQNGDMENFPIIIVNKKHVASIVEECISLCRTDWDSFDTSWDFQRHPLIRCAPFSIEEMREDAKHHTTDYNEIEEAFVRWSNECFLRFEQLKANEEELNRIFIDIYSLQDELTPEVEDKDVTVRRADLGRDIRSLISYAVGCMFGRYSLDVPGLAYAGGAWDADKYSTYLPDDDNCLPITDEDYGLKDDVVNRFVDFIRVVYGEATLEENLDFIARALGNKGDTSRDVIRNYFLNDFFGDHCRTYSVTGSGKRPIYWLFDSGKANGFKALVYMHRWTADTVGNLRVEYLHRMQRVYEKEIERMQDTIDNARDSREVARATKRREKLVKQLKEARDYDAKIAHVALSRVEIDLDDGVKVNYEKVQKGPDGKSLGILAKI